MLPLTLPPERRLSAAFAPCMRKVFIRSHPCPFVVEIRLMFFLCTAIANHARSLRGILEATLAYHTFSSSTEEKARMRSRFRFHVIGFSVATLLRCATGVSYHNIVLSRRSSVKTKHTGTLM